MSSTTKRKKNDLMKLIMSDYKVEIIDDSMHKFFVFMNGPPNSSYVGGLWKVRVELPDDYPYSPPLINFVNKIYHPNVDQVSGTICVDVLNRTWSPMSDLVNVFETFLPRLLLYPNAVDDPLNIEAAALILNDKETYEKRVKECCERYAKPEDVGAAEVEKTSDKEVNGGGKDSGDDAGTSAALGPVNP